MCHVSTADLEAPRFFADFLQALIFLASQNNVWIQEPAAKSWHQLFNNSLVTCTDFSSTCAPQWQEKLQYVLP
jgi:hypothetical protein